MWSKPLNRTPALSLAGANVQGVLPAPQHRLHLFEILAVPAGLLSLADALLTRYLVGIGRVQEGNPLMARLLADNQFLWFKVIGMGLCLGLLWRVSKRFPRLAGASALFIMVFYCGVLIWNSSVLSAT
jgi:hypothetical protein